MKPINNPELKINIIHNADATHTCDQSYDAIAETVKAGGHVTGYYVDKSTGAGRTGASVGVIQGAAYQTIRDYVAFRYVATTFNPSTGAAAGSLTTIYMKPDGTFTTSPS